MIFRDADRVIFAARSTRRGRMGAKLAAVSTPCATAAVRHTELVLAGLWGALWPAPCPICAAKCRLMWMRAWLRAILRDLMVFAGKYGLTCAKACAPTTVFSALWMPRLFRYREPFDYDHFHVGCGNEGNAGFRATVNIAEGIPVRGACSANHPLPGG